MSFIIKMAKQMTRRNRLVSAAFIIIIAIILNTDTLFSKSFESFVSHIVHCIVEGIIILMFSRELRAHE